MGFLDSFFGNDGQDIDQVDKMIEKNDRIYGKISNYKFNQIEDKKEEQLNQYAAIGHAVFQLKMQIDELEKLQDETEKLKNELVADVVEDVDGVEPEDVGLQKIKDESVGAIVADLAPAENDASEVSDVEEEEKQ